MTTWEQPRTRRGPAVVVLAVVSVLLLAAAAAGLTLWLVERSAHADTAQRADDLRGHLAEQRRRLAEQPRKIQAATDALLSASKELGVILTSYDYRTIDDDVQRLLDHATGEFAEEYRAASASLRSLVTTNKVTSTGKVIAAGVVRADPHRAKLVLFVDQKVSSKQTSKPRIDRIRIQLATVARGDRWLIADVVLK